MPILRVAWDFTFLFKAERKTLKGRVFDILGKLFAEKSLHELLIEAIRYGDDPVIKARLDQVIDNRVNRDRLIKLLEEKALVHETLTTAKLDDIREQMERAQARRLQPHFIQSFFLEALQHLNGQIAPRETGRFEIKRVPGTIRDRDRLRGRGDVIQARYERICFEKSKINQHPVAAGMGRETQCEAEFSESDGESRGVERSPAAPIEAVGTRARDCNVAASGKGWSASNSEGAFTSVDGN